MLVDEAKRHFERSRTPGDPVSNAVEVWTWDSAKRQPVPELLSSADASRFHAAQLAKKAFSILPDDPDVRLLHMATVFEYVAYLNGRDKPLETGAGTPAGEASQYGVEAIEGLLRFGIEGGHVAAATAAAEILGRIGSTEECIYRGPEPSPLVSAVRQADRRLRFAAMNTVLTLDPKEPFAGSSHITDELMYFAGTSGRPRALVADPSIHEAQRLGGFLATMGYEFDIVSTGRELIRLAFSSPDYELALVAARIQKPTANFLIQQLRRDRRTARLPIGIVARAGEMDRAEHMARHDPLAIAFHRQHSQEAMHSDVERLLGLLGPDYVAHAERQRQADAALDWLVELGGAEQGIYSIQRVQPAMLAVLYVPGFGGKAAQVLGTLGTATSQQTLVDVASRPALPIELRRAATQAFSHNVRQYGILLTSQQLLQQYDRYNASETMDAATQQLLGHILDVIEASSRAGGGGVE
jgi:hypothetical protein